MNDDAIHPGDATATPAQLHARAATHRRLAEALGRISAQGAADGQQRGAWATEAAAAHQAAAADLDQRAAALVQFSDTWPNGTPAMLVVGLAAAADPTRLPHCTTTTTGDPQ